MNQILHMITIWTSTTCVKRPIGLGGRTRLQLVRRNGREIAQLEM